MVMTTVLKINEIPGIPIPAEFRWDQMYWMGFEFRRNERNDSRNFRNGFHGIILVYLK